MSSPAVDERIRTRNYAELVTVTRSTKMNVEYRERLSAAFGASTRLTSVPTSLPNSDMCACTQLKYFSRSAYAAAPFYYHPTGAREEGKRKTLA